MDAVLIVDCGPDWKRINKKPIICEIREMHGLFIEFTNWGGEHEEEDTVLEFSARNSCSDLNCSCAAGDKQGPVNHRFESGDFDQNGGAHSAGAED